MTRCVLVTGASGFIGRQTLRLLVAKGYDVHAVSLQSMIEIEGVTWHHANLLDANARKALIEKVQPTHVLHFAWIATPGIYWTSPLNAEWLEATIDLLRLCTEAGVMRFVASGTCAEYDWSIGECNEETTPLKPSTPYGEAKVEAGRAVIAAHGAMSTAWGRIFFLYGPHEHPKRLVSSVINALLHNETARCSPGTQVRDFLHIADVASAFVALLESDATGAMNIASGKPTSIRNVVEEIGSQMGKSSLIDCGALPTPPNDPPLLTASVERLHTIGWVPHYTLESGIADTIEWWESHS